MKRSRVTLEVGADDREVAAIAADGAAADEEVTRASYSTAAVEPLHALVPGLVVLAHPDPRRVGEEAPLVRLEAGGTERLSRREPDFAQPRAEAEPRPLGDGFLSRRPLLLGPGATPGSILLSRDGSPTRVTVGGEEVVTSRTFEPAEVERGIVLVLARRIALLLHPLHAVPPSAPCFGLVGESAATLRLRREIASAASLDAPVLLRGETGTGKELVARALHQHGRRRGGPFVAVNMAALLPSLAAAELFGAGRGAYTGAERRRTGFFQSAHGGTLFLDEVGDVPPEVQAILLRALETGEVHPVGSVEPEPVDVRIVAATDAHLEAAVAERRFRAPLLHRLAAVEIRLPPLRERRDDVARLLVHFLREEDEGDDGRAEARTERPWPPAEVVAQLVAHAWPGNVRQLRNVARRLLTARRDGLGDRALVELVARLLAEPPAPPAASTPSVEAAPNGAGVPGSRRRYRRPADVQREELLAALAAHRWQLQDAARALRVSRGTLYRLMESHALRKAVDLRPAEIDDALARHGGDVVAAARELEVSAPALARRRGRADVRGRPAASTDVTEVLRPAVRPGTAVARRRSEPK